MEESLDDPQYTELFVAHEEGLLSDQSPAVTLAEATVHQRQLDRDLLCARRLCRVLRPRAATSASARHNAPVPWSTLGRFRLRRELGRGGFGIVYLADDPALGRKIALKVPRPEVAVTPELLQRFRTEARAAAALDHPNIVPVHEVGEVGPVCFLVSAYCPGITLAHWLRRHPGLLPFAEAAALCATLAEAVHHAHARGVLHRDLKPANVLLSGEPATSVAGSAPLASATIVPRITDFGLAKLVEEGPGQTRSGAVVGTPAYMAPEQASGKSKDIGPAADVYALGAILYEMLTGRPPFVGDSDLDTLLQVQSAEPLPPSRLRPRLPRDLETICLKCLRKEPEKRYASAGDLAADLRRFLAGGPILARPLGRCERLWRWCRRNPVMAALVGTVAALLLVVSIVSTLAAWRQAELLKQTQEAQRATELANLDLVAAQGEEKKQRQRAERLLVQEYVARGWRLADGGDLAGALPWFAEALRLEQDVPERAAMHRYRLAAVLRQQPELVHAWWHEDEVRCATFSPDGGRVVTAGDDWTARVWDVATGRSLVAPLRHHGPVSAVAFSPDGSRLITAAEFWESGSIHGVLHLWDAATGKPLGSPLRGLEGRPLMAFSPDGQWVAAGGGKTARVWDATTGQPLSPLLHHDESIVHLALGPLSGTRATGCRLIVAQMNGVLSFWDPAGGNLLRRGKHPNSALFTAVHPSGAWYVTTGTDFKARIWNAADGSERAVLDHAGNVAQARVSPDGRLLLTACHDRTVGLWEFATGKELWTRPHGGRVVTARFSPDGRQVIAGGDDGVARVWDVATGAAVLPLLRHAGTVHDAAVSKDGTLFLTASADGAARLHRRPPFRTHELPQAAFVRFLKYGPQRPDGAQWIAACGDKEVHVWNAADGRRIAGPLMHDRLVYYADFSPPRPDGGARLVTGGGDWKARVWQLPSGSLERILPHDGIVWSAEFSPDGRSILTTAGTERLQPAWGAVSLWDAASGTLRYPPQRQPVRVHRATFHPDGDRFLSAFDDTFARIHDAATGRELTRLHHDGQFGQALYGPGGRRILSRTPKEARLWDAATAQPVGVPMKHRGNMRYTALSPDGRRVVTCADDGTARVWDADTGRPLGHPLEHAGRVLHAAFSPDGLRVATASDDGSARVWDAQTGEPLTAGGKWHDGWVYQVAFSPDGRQLATSGAPPDVALWDVRGDDRPAADLAALASLLAAQSLGDQGTLPLDPAPFRAAWLRHWQKYPADLRGGPVPTPESAGRQHYFQGRLRNNAQQWEEARAEFGRAAEQLPDEPWPHLERAYALLKLKRLDEALVDLRRAVDLGRKDGEVQRAVGILFADWGRWEEAVSPLVRAVSLGVEDVQVKVRLGVALAVQGNYAEAVPELSRVLDEESENWMALSWRGNSYMALEQQERAAADYERAVARDTSDAWAWFQHACFLLERGDHTGYRRLCQRMVKRFPTDTPSYSLHYVVRTALLAGPSTVAPGELVRLAEGSLRDNPESSAHWFVRVAADYRAGRLAEVVRAGEQSPLRGEGLGQLLPQAQLILAMASHRLGRTEQARRWFAAAKLALDDEGRFKHIGGRSTLFSIKGLRRERRFLLREADVVLQTPPASP